MYGYLQNQTGDRRSPIARKDTLAKWLKGTSPAWEGEVLEVVMMSDDDWQNDNYPGNWVGDDGSIVN